MKKKIIMLLSILLLTGCTVNYNLEIDDNILEAYKYLKKKGYRKYTI